MAVTLELYLVDKQNMGKYYKDEYENEADFLNSFWAAIYDDSGEFLEECIQIMREPSIEDIPHFILFTFFGLWAHGSSVQMSDENDIRAIINYWPNAIHDSDIAMISRLIKDYKLDAYNKTHQWPDTTSQELLEWLRRNIGKEVHLIYA